MSLKKFMRNTFKAAEAIESTQKRKSKPANNLSKEQESFSPSFFREATLSGTPHFVNLMKEFYERNKSIVPPECWVFPEGVDCALDLVDHGHFEVYEAFREASRKVSEAYFDCMHQIQENYKAGGDRGKALTYCTISLAFLQPFVKYEVLEYGSFDINTIPAIEIGAELYLEKNMQGQLKNLQEVVENIPELIEWKKMIEEQMEYHAYMRELIKEVEDKIRQEPGILQKDIKKSFGEGNDGHVQRAIRSLTDQGRIERKKKGSSYELNTKD